MESAYRKMDLATHTVRILFFTLVTVFLFSLLYGLKELAVPFSIAFLLWIFLNPAVDFFEGLGINRLLSVMIVLLLLVGSVYVVLLILIPPLFAEGQKFAAEISRLSEILPDLIQSARKRLEFILPDTYSNIKIDIPWLVNLVLGPVRDSNLLASIPNLITYSIITPIVLFIFLLQGDEIFREVMALVPNRFFEMTLLITHQIRHGIVSYLKGLSVQILILASILLPGFWIIDLPYAPVLALFAAAVNVIPYAGPAIGAAPAVIVALLTGNGLTVPVLIVIAIAQAVDNAFTQPVILARSVDVHPIIAVLAVITFQQWMGFAGMVIAIPLAGIMVMTIQTMYRSLKSFGVI
jgi:predicted PurR-regulated permease PerM